MLVVGVKITSDLHCNCGNPNIVRRYWRSLSLQHLEYTSIVIACLKRDRAFFHRWIEKEIIQCTEIFHALFRGCNSCSELAKQTGTGDRPQEMLIEKSHKRTISTGYMRLRVRLALNEP